MSSEEKERGRDSQRNIFKNFWCVLKSAKWKSAAHSQRTTWLLIQSVDVMCSIIYFLQFFSSIRNWQLSFFLLKRKQNWEKTKQNKARMRLDEGREIFAHTKQTKRTYTRISLRESVREKTLKFAQFPANAQFVWKQTILRLAYVLSVLFILAILCNFFWGR